MMQKKHIKNLLSTLVKHFQGLILLVFMIGISPQLAAQLCSKNDTPETISPSNYEINDFGELRDLRISNNNLTWRRCLYGQQWDNASQSCTGNPIKLNWQNALLTAKSNGWRLPNTKELMSIVDLQCFSPPLHPVLFPEAPASLTSGLWTSTPLQTNLDGSETYTAAWTIGLGHGKLRHQTINQLNFVIFVKN
ncbi:MAG: DUF1566 domain-containing protein [Gammaproteobacteria bacterium]|nr:DUF1566 domain-containing protein [Gammaproteobacteria bacterium]